MIWGSKKKCAAIHYESVTRYTDCSWFLTSIASPSSQRVTEKEEGAHMLASKFWIFLVRPHQAAFFNWQMLEQLTSFPKATIILVSTKNRGSIIQSSRSPLMGSWERLLSLRMFRNHHWIFECMYTIKPEQEVPASGVWFCPVSYKFGHCWLEVLRRRLLQRLKYQNILS